MPTNIQFEPFRSVKDLEIRIVDVFDPTDESRRLEWREDDGDDEATSIRIIGQKWDKLELAITVTAPDASIRSALPEGSDPSENTALLLSVRCRATKVRDAVRANPEGDSRWSATVLLDRNTVHTTVQITPLLVRTTRAATRSPGIASEYASLIGEGRPVRVMIDERDIPVGGSFKIVWEDFRDSLNRWRVDHADDIYHLDLTSAERPTLFLNSRYGALKAALHSGRSKGIDAVVRHLANGLIAQTVWMQLLMASVSGIRADSDTGIIEEPTSKWQSAVLRKFLAQMYPLEAADERLKKAAESQADVAGAQMFASLAGTAVQQQIKTFKLIEMAERAGEASLGKS